MSAFLGWSLIANRLQCRICWTGHVANGVLAVDDYADAEARAEAAALQASHTAEQVRASVIEYDLDSMQRSAAEAVTATLAALTEALERRDAASDAADHPAGEAQLAAAATDSALP